MKIITVNLPNQIVHKIESLSGEKKLYPSRSELVRIAVRNYIRFLVKDNLGPNMNTKITKIETPPISTSNPDVILVPYSLKDKEVVFREFKLVKRERGGPANANPH